MDVGEVFKFGGGLFLIFRGYDIIQVLYFKCTSSVN